MDWNKITNRTIKSSGALVLIFTLATLVIQGIFFSTTCVFKIIGLTAIYMLLALLSDDSRGIGQMFDQVWDIYITRTLKPDEKLEVIKDFIAAAVTKWDKYWELYQKVSKNGDFKKRTRKERLRSYVDKILHGEINIMQGIWIFVYLTYSVLFCGVVQIPIPFDIIVIVGILMIILYTSGSIRGISKFMEEVFKTLHVEDESQIKTKLTLLETLIVNGAKNYYYLSAKREEIMTEQNKRIIEEYELISNGIKEA